MINIKDKYVVLGLMSGTSMDGLDISCAEYYKTKDRWRFKLLQSQTFSYNQSVKSDFLKLFNREQNIEDVDIKFAHIISDSIISFLENYNLNPDLISSHGHTIFHQPENGYTLQIGSGKIIAERIKIPVVNNFRQQDINFGGQGAPLVPVGDKLLFSEYDACINLGGIVNISYDYNNLRIAYDITPCNIILNHLSEKKGQEYDHEGNIALAGQVHKGLLKRLSTINYYKLSFPKSLGKEHVDKEFFPIIDSYKLSPEDLLCTYVEHISIQIANIFSEYNISNALFTGGGVFNSYLISRIQYHTNTEIILPSNQLINFKEAIIFGFLGLLRYINEDNCFASSTGANKNHSSGDIYYI
jgi:anhydro-N-acetylmuramic acid kinase